MAKKKTENIQQNVVLYSKEQILNSKRYSNRRDALGVILADDKMYTKEDVDSLLEQFMKGKVN